MPIVEAFYILVLDKIRAQPHLENERRWLESTLGISEKVIDVLIEILDSGDWQLKLAATGFKGLKQFNLPVASFARHFGDWHAWKFKHLRSAIEKRLRGSIGE